MLQAINAIKQQISIEEKKGDIEGHKEKILANEAYNTIAYNDTIKIICAPLFGKSRAQAITSLWLSSTDNTVI